MRFRPTLSRLTPFERLLTVFTSVRPGEGASVLHLFVSGFVLMFAYYLLKPIREALILSDEGSAELRAYVVGIVAVTLVFVVPLYTQLFRGLADPERKSRVLRWIICFFISNLGIFWALGAADVPVAIPYFVWLSIFNVMVVAQFWAFAADLYNTRSGQRLFPVIMVGLSIGAWAGATTAGQAFESVGPYPLMLLAGLLLTIPLALSIFAERNIPDGSEAIEAPDTPPPPLGFANVLGGFETVFRSRYLLLIAGLMFFVNMINTTGEFILADFVKAWATAEAASTGVEEARLIGQVMASYYAWISLLALLIQLFIVSRLFRRFGVRGAILILPVFMVFHYAVLVVVPAFFLVRWLLITENGINYSLQNTINHALYLPLTREQKYVGKTTIDTFFWRFGDLAQAGLVFAGLNLLGWQIGGFIVANLVLAVFVVAIAYRLRRHHRSVIRERMTNLPPEIVSPLPDVHVPSGQLLMFSVPDQCFMDPDPGDTIEYDARTPDGGPLPPWIRFDRHNQTFTVRPPADASGRQPIELTARDFEGLTVTASFAIDYGPSLKPAVDAMDS